MTSTLSSSSAFNTSSISNSSVVVPVLECFNGGVLSSDGGSCICAGGWSGLRCNNQSVFEFPSIYILLGFLIISVSAHSLGQLVPKYLKLPLITGYLLAGIIAGPSLLDLLPESEIRALNFVDNVSLCVIAFSAGVKLYLPEFANRKRSVALVTSGVIFVEYILGTFVVYIMGLLNAVLFMESFSNTQKFVVALMTATLMIARSPATLIAIQDELRAKGPFISLSVAVTVCTDLIVILLFAVNQLISNAAFAHAGAADFFISIGRIIISLLLGILLGRGLPLLLFRWDALVRKDTKTRKDFVDFIQCAMFVTFCFFLSLVDQYEALMIDALLVSMTAGFVIANHTIFRPRVLRVLKLVSPIIYVGFFTLTGAALELSSLDEALGLSLVLFLSRALSIFIGSYFGAKLANESTAVANYSWMGYLTQAGVSLGLAKKVHLSFPEWGGSFATVIVSVVIANQIIGPPLCRYVIRKVGEANAREWVAKGNSVVITDGDDLDLTRQHDLQSLTHLLRESQWSTQIFMYWQLEDEVKKSSFEDVIARIVSSTRLDHLAIKGFPSLDDDDDDGKDNAMEMKKLRVNTEEDGSDSMNEKIFTAGASDGDSVVVLHSSRDNMRNELSDAANSVLTSIDFNHKSINALVLVLSDDKLIMEICNFMAVHHPQIQLIVRLVPSSSLTLAQQDTKLEDAIILNLLPHYVNIVHPTLATSQLIAEMMIDPNTFAGSTESKNSTASLSKKISAGVFGSVQSLHDKRNVHLEEGLKSPRAVKVKK